MGLGFDAGLTGGIGDTSGAFDSVGGSSMGGLSGFLTGSSGADAAKKAAAVQAAAAAEQKAYAQEQFLTTEAGFQPYMEGGERAFQLQQALSGVLGPEAQAEAYQNYQQSPGVLNRRPSLTRSQYYLQCAIVFYCRSQFDRPPLQSHVFDVC